MTTDGSSTSASVRVSGNGSSEPLVLVTVDHPPVDSSDGKRFGLGSVNLQISEPGTSTLYFTLVNRNRFLSTPYMKKVRIYLSRPPAPFVSWELISGILNFKTHADSFNVKEYRLEYGEKIFTSRIGDFNIPVRRFENFQGFFYSIRLDGTRSDPTIVDIALNEDKPPVGRVVVEKPYIGGAIEFVVLDDWDSYPELSIEASLRDIDALYADGYLLPLVELPEGIYDLDIRVVDSSNNKWIYNRKHQVTKLPSLEIPELYIEEGTLRQAKWKTIDKEPVIQRFMEGRWQDIIYPGSTESSAPLSRDFVSQDGDLYRLLLKSDDDIHLPSLPIFAKESYFRRFTSQYIVSLMGGDALFSGGNSYTLHGNIVVKEGSVLRVEPGTTINFTRGNVLLVGGVMDFDGRKENIKLGSIGSAGTIEVSTGGSIIARGVDFGNTRLVVNEGAVIVLDRCKIKSDLVINSAQSVQIYNSEFSGDVLFNNIEEFIVSSSTFDHQEFKIRFVGSADIIRSDFITEALMIEDGNLRILDSRLNSSRLDISELSSVKVFGGSFNVVDSNIYKGSSFQIGNKVLIDMPVKINISSFSSFRVSSELKERFVISKDSFSFSYTY